MIELIEEFEADGVRWRVGMEVVTVKPRTAQTPDFSSLEDCVSGEYWRRGRYTPPVSKEMVGTILKMTKEHAEVDFWGAIHYFPIAELCPVELSGLSEDVLERDEFCSLARIYAQR